MPDGSIGVAYFTIIEHHYKRGIMYFTIEFENGNTKTLLETTIMQYEPKAILNILEDFGIKTWCSNRICS